MADSAMVARFIRMVIDEILKMRGWANNNYREIMLVAMCLEIALLIIIVVQGFL